MMDEYEISYLDPPAWEVIGKGLRQFNLQQAGLEHSSQLCFVLYDQHQDIMGGIIGEVHHGWLHIVLMWIQEELRGRGYGHQLITAMEEEARKRGARQAWLDTFSFQAPEFYKTHGYGVFGVLEDFPARHQRYFLHKQL